MPSDKVTIHPWQNWRAYIGLGQIELPSGPGAANHSGAPNYQHISTVPVHTHHARALVLRYQLPPPPPLLSGPGPMPF